MLQVIEILLALFVSNNQRLQIAIFRVTKMANFYYINLGSRY